MRRDADTGTPVQEWEVTAIVAWESRYEQLFEIAAESFLQTGYHGTSVRDLARRARISQSAIYHYFPSKSEILVQIHSALIDNLLPQLEEIRGKSSSAEEKLKLFISKVIELVAQRRKYIAVFLWERRFLPSKRAAEIQAKRDKVDRILDDILTEGVREGIFRGDLPIKSARMAILGMILWCVEWLNSQGPISPQQFSDDFADIVLKGIVRK